MSSFLLEFEGNRNDYINLIKNSEEDIVFKFTAEWCKPCKSIKNFLEEYFEECQYQSVKCYEVDVDENFDLYAYLKTKKMINGIPTLMHYIKENKDFVPTNSISGTDLKAIDLFFKKIWKL